MSAGGAACSQVDVDWTCDAVAESCRCGRPPGDRVRRIKIAVRPCRWIVEQSTRTEFRQLRTTPSSGVYCASVAGAQLVSRRPRGRPEVLSGVAAFIEPMTPGRRGQPVFVQRGSIITASSGASAPSKSTSCRIDPSRTRPCRSTSTASVPMLIAMSMRRPSKVRDHATTFAPRSSVCCAPSLRVASEDRRWSRRRYRARIESGSVSWVANERVVASSVNGSHGSGPQPCNASADQGIGARQPSRPPGSTTASAGIVASPRPSSSPAYR